MGSLCARYPTYSFESGGVPHLLGVQNRTFLFIGQPQIICFTIERSQIYWGCQKGIYGQEMGGNKFHHITTSNLYVASGGNPLVHKTPVGEHKALKRPVSIRSPPQAAWCGVKVDFQVQGCYEGWCYIWWICKWLMVYQNIYNRYIYIYLYYIYNIYMMSFFPKIQPLKPSPSPWFADLRLVELQLLILLMPRGSEMQSWTGSIRWHRLQVLTILVSWCKTYRGWDRPYGNFFNCAHVELQLDEEKLCI